MTMSVPPTPTIMILAGQRLGKADPLALAHGQEHKCLIRLLDRPLIGYVLEAVDKAFPESPIVVSINDPAALAGLPEVQPFLDSGRMRIVTARSNLLESVLAAAGDIEFPLLMTTGDNVLVTSDAYRRFHTSALDQQADAAAMLAHKEDVLAEHPQAQSRFWKFADGEFSNCNAFWARDREALEIAEIFRGGGQFLKFPKRFVGAFGILNLIGYRFGKLRSQTMLERISRRFGKKIRVQIAERGRFAIDVDDQDTYEVTERLLLQDAGIDPGR